MKKWNRRENDKIGRRGDVSTAEKRFKCCARRKQDGQQAVDERSAKLSSLKRKGSIFHLTWWCTQCSLTQVLSCGRGAPGSWMLWWSRVCQQLATRQMINGITLLWRVIYDCYIYTSMVTWEWYITELSVEYLLVEIANETNNHDY